MNKVELRISSTYWYTATNKSYKEQEINIVLIINDQQYSFCK